MMLPESWQQSSEAHKRFQTFRRLWSVVIPKWRRLVAKRPQVDVSFCPMMDLVVERILDCDNPRHLTLAERLPHYPEPRRRDLRELLIQLRRLIVPKAQKLAFCLRLSILKWFPFSGRNALDKGNRHADQLQGISPKVRMPPTEKWNSLSSGNASMVFRVGRLCPCHFHLHGPFGLTLRYELDTPSRAE